MLVQIISYLFHILLALPPLSWLSKYDWFVRLFIEIEGLFFSKSCLSDRAILYHRKRGNIIIEPFHMEQLCTASYDVRIGPNFLRERRSPNVEIFNPYHKEGVDEFWGVNTERAIKHRDWLIEDLSRKRLMGVGLDEELIWLQPGERILGHTIEFIGAQNHTITTKMQARSSIGRIGVTVCECAGLGDIGYFGQWTLEITNKSRNHSVCLIVGHRVAQIVFFDTDGTLRGKSYNAGGKYQNSNKLEQVQRMWRENPGHMMKPKLYMDRECLAAYVSENECS